MAYQVKGTCQQFNTYVAPVFVTNDPTNITIETHKITTSGFSTSYVSTSTPVVDLRQDEIYVYQVELTGTDAEYPSVGYGDQESTDGNEDQVFWQLSSTNLRVGSVFDGSASIGNLGIQKQFTVVLDTNTREQRIYLPDGSLFALRGYARDFTGDDGWLRLNFNGYPTGTVLEFFFDKTAFPYDTTLGDLGTYLTANPNWKQVGERSGAEQGTLTPLPNVEIDVVSAEEVTPPNKANYLLYYNQDENGTNQGGLGGNPIIKDDNPSNSAIDTNGITFTNANANVILDGDATQQNNERITGNLTLLATITPNLSGGIGFVFSCSQESEAQVDNFLYSLEVRPSELRFFSERDTGSNITIDAPVSLVDGTTYELAVVRQTTSATTADYMFYVDRQLVYTTSGDLTNGGNNTRLSLGAVYNAATPYGGFVGNIANAAIINQALDEDGIKAVFYEWNGQSGILSLGRTATDANGEYSINVGTFTDDVLVSAYYTSPSTFSEMVASTSNVTIEGSNNTQVRQSVNTGVNYNARSSVSMPSNTGLYYWQVNGLSSGTQDVSVGVVSTSALVGLADTNSNIAYQSNTNLQDSVGTRSSNDPAFGGAAYRISSNSVNEGYESVSVTPNVDLRRTFVFDSGTTEFFVYSESGELLGSKKVTEAAHDTEWYVASSVVRSGLTNGGAITFYFDPENMFTLPSGLPSGAKTVSSVGNPLTPQVKRGVPTEVGYVEPELFPRDSNVEVVGGTRVQRITTSGTGRAGTNETDLIVSGNDKVYVFQYMWDSNRVDGIQMTDQNDITNGQVNYINITQEGMSVLAGGNQSTTPNSNLQMGIVVLDLPAKTISIYSSLNGDLNRQLTYNGDFTGDLYVGTQFVSDPVGNGLTYWFDKTTFPYDITQGDLGAYLAANTGWKQVGEA